MASGNTLLTFTPQANNPPSSGYATPDIRGGLFVLDFDPTTDETAIFVGILPRNYAGGGLTVSLHWMASSAVSGSTRWDVAIERHQAGVDDQDTDSFATSVTAGTAAASPSGTEMITALAFTNGAAMDSLAVGERFRLRVRRDADQTSGTDDMAGDAELSSIEIRET